MQRYLPHFAYSDAEDNTPDKCIATCKDAGFDYAGLQFGKECWCGPKLAGPPTKPTDCDFKVSTLTPLPAFLSCLSSADALSVH